MTKVSEIKGHQAIVEKAKPLDYSYYQALSETLSEWQSLADAEAYNDAELINDDNHPLE